MLPLIDHTQYLVLIFFKLMRHATFISIIHRRNLTLTNISEKIHSYLKSVKRNRSTPLFAREQDRKCHPSSDSLYSMRNRISAFVASENMLESSKKQQKEHLQTF